MRVISSPSTDAIHWRNRRIKASKQRPSFADIRLLVPTTLTVIEVFNVNIFRNRYDAPEYKCLDARPVYIRHEKVHNAA